MATRRAVLGLLGAAVAARRAPWAAPPPSVPPAAAAPARVTRIRTLQTFRLADALLVRLEDEDGTVGWGEAAPDSIPVAEAFIRHELARFVIGEDPFDVERIWDRMFYGNHDLGPGGALPNAIAGIDLALWDLMGKRLALPACDLLGGRYRDRIRAYGSFGIGTNRRLTPADAAAKARKFVQAGFTVVKLRMQIRELQQDPQPDYVLDYARAVRAAIGPEVKLMVDINNGWTPARAIELGKRLQGELDVWFLEEPVSDQTHRLTAEVVRALDVPIIAGEKEYTRWQLRELITDAEPDYLNPDTIKAGGLTEMKKIAAIAQAYDKPIICHNTRPALGTAASLHFVASIRNCGPVIEYPDVDEFRAQLALFPEPLVFREGFLHVPMRPGLGLTPDEAAVRRAVVPS
ncbi:MAG: mandelate racemase/muconate lactonizing enzyme family protein [Gemmatimonadaceae bacterium]|nr:mandelate racemase/muconate lactonizing enzyme family protein [Gemmatimonadaceae bacterium]